MEWMPSWKYLKAKWQVKVQNALNAIFLSRLKVKIDLFWAIQTKEKYQKHDWAIFKWSYLIQLITRWAYGVDKYKEVSYISPK